MNRRVVVLSGGVGGAKLVLGLSHLVTDQRLVVACNTSDDFVHLGLHISPDIDSVFYALAGLSDEQRGWGRRDESWAFMAALDQLGGENWFNLGDADLALHVLRTQMLDQGMSLSEVTSRLVTGLGITAELVPMSDERVSTRVLTSDGELMFQHYFVRDQCVPEARGFRFDGIEDAAPARVITEALEDDPRAIIIAPSNPYVSIDPILGLKNMRQALISAKAPVVAVSPIIGGQAIKGPAAKMMTEMGEEVSSIGIARHYAGLIDGLVIDSEDAKHAAEIEAMGIRVLVTPTRMTDLGTRIRLARDTLDFAARIAS
jgi:LPPG:FO 2-phospho-L-lactate transferase